MTFIKGKSGNPATQFSASNQPLKNGRKGKVISEYLREFGEAKSVEYEITVTKEGKSKTKKGKIESLSTLNEVIATTLLSKAMTGDLKAINIVLDRIEGRPNQKLDVDIPQLEVMTVEERRARIKELLLKAKEDDG